MNIDEIKWDYIYCWMYYCKYYVLVMGKEDIVNKLNLEF